LKVVRSDNIKPSPQLHVEGAITILPDRVSQDLKGKVGSLSHKLVRQRDLADLPGTRRRPQGILLWVKISRKGNRRTFAFFRQRRGRSCESGCACPSWACLHQVVSKHRKSFFAFCSREKKKKWEFTMPLRRRGRQSPDSGEERELSREREVSRDRGMQGHNLGVERGM
jgi:hypothetical protein